MNQFMNGHTFLTNLWPIHLVSRSLYLYWVFRTICNLFTSHLAHVLTTFRCNLEGWSIGVLITMTKGQAVVMVI